MEITPSTGMVSPGEDRSWSPHLTSSAGMIFSPLPSSPERCGGEVDQLFNPRPGLGHGEVLQKAAQLHDEGHLAGAKSSPMSTEATRAMDTSTSALMSKAVTRPMMASSRIGTPQRRMATKLIHRQILPQKNAAQERHAAEDQEGDVLLGPAPRQKRLLNAP